MGYYQQPKPQPPPPSFGYASNESNHSKPRAPPQAPSKSTGPPPPMMSAIGYGGKSDSHGRQTSQTIAGRPASYVFFVFFVCVYMWFLCDMRK